MKNIFNNTLGFSLAALVGILYFGTGMFYGFQMVISCLLPAITFVFIFEVINAIKEKREDSKVQKVQIENPHREVWRIPDLFDNYDIEIKGTKDEKAQ